MDINNFIPKAKELVVEHTNVLLVQTNADTTGMDLIQSKDVYVVWFSKTLQNAKALLSTNISDGMYYEVTYNGDKNEIYFDAYKKLHNMKVEV